MLDIHILGNDGSIEFPPERYGGGEKVAYSIALELSKKKDCKVTLYWGGGKESRERTGNLNIVRVRTDNVPKKYFLFEKPRGAHFSKCVSKMIPNKRNSIVHIFHGWTAFGITMPGKKNNRIFFTAQNNYAPQLRTLLRFFLPNFWINSLASRNYWIKRVLSSGLQSWFCMKNSDGITFVSRANKRAVLESTFLKSAITKKPLAVIYNCIDISLYKNERTSEKDYILFVGQFSKKKGLDTLFRAFSEIEKRHPKTKLVVAAPLEASSERKKMFSLIKRSCLQNLEIIDNPKLEDLKVLYGNCKFLVLPSRFQEPFGLVILEAWASKKPVIATKAGGIPEIIDESRNGMLVEPGNTSQLIDAMDYLLSNPRERKRLGKNGFEKLGQKYSAGQKAEEYYNFYRQAGVQEQ